MGEEYFHKCPECDALQNSIAELKSHITMSHHHNHNLSEDTGIR
jgi:uncharacterized C2H2 Zn-finger protein